MGPVVIVVHKLLPQVMPQLIGTEGDDAPTDLMGWKNYAAYRW
jgi:hypothetical protein